MRLRQLPQLAAGRHVPDLRSGGHRPGRRDRLQLRAGGRLRDRAAHRPDDGQRRSERDPPAAAGRRGRRCEPHRRDLLPVADRQHLDVLGVVGQGGPGRAAARLWAQDGRADVLRGARHAEAARARLRPRGVPQPRWVQRLSPPLGRVRLLRAGGADAQLPRAGGRVHGLRHRRRQAVTRGEEEHHRRVGWHHPSRRIDPGGHQHLGRHALPATVRRRTRHACLLRAPGLAAGRAAGSDRRRERLADDRRQHAAAGVRGAADERRQSPALRHL